MLCTNTEYLRLEEALEGHLVCRQGHLDLVAQDLSAFEGVNSSSQFSMISKPTSYALEFCIQGQDIAVYGT